MDTSERTSALAGSFYEAALKQGLETLELSRLMDAFFLEEVDLSLPYSMKLYHKDDETKKKCSDDPVVFLKKQYSKKKKKPDFLHVVQTFEVHHRGSELMHPWKNSMSVVPMSGRII